jgi:hypothetical protein
MTYRIGSGGRGTSRRGGKRITEEPVQEGAAAPPDKTRKDRPSGVGLGQNLFELAWGRCT